MNEDVWPSSETTPRRIHLIPRFKSDGAASILKVQIFHERDIRSQNAFIESSQKKEECDGKEQPEKIQYSLENCSSGFEIDNENWMDEDFSQSELRKKKNFETCSLCRVTVEVNKRRQHVYSKHLSEKRFRCPLCPLSSAYHRKNVEVHIRQKHNRSLSPIIGADRSADEVNMWMYRCFGDQKMLRFLDADVVSTVFGLVDQVCSGLGPTASSSPKPTKAQKIVACKICNLQGIKHLQRHILQYHLRKPVFFCPYCQYASNYAKNAVKDHIRNIHGLPGDIEDIRDQYWSILEDWNRRCFPCSTFSNAPVPQFL